MKLLSQEFFLYLSGFLMFASLIVFLVFVPKDIIFILIVGFGLICLGLYYVLFRQKMTGEEKISKPKLKLSLRQD